MATVPEERPEGTQILADIDPMDWVVGAIIFWGVHKLADYLWGKGKQLIRRILRVLPGVPQDR